MKKRVTDSLITRIIAVFLICSFLYMFVFIVMSLFREKTMAEQNTINNLQELVNEKSQLISVSFSRVEKTTKSLGLWYEKFLKDGSKNEIGKLPADYSVNRDDTITRKKNPDKELQAQCALYIANTEQHRKELYREILLSEHLDEPFSNAKDNEDVSWVYLVTESNILRCCPYSDLPAHFLADHNQREDPFYINATERNNPARHTVWTNPYVDYLGTGWTMTCSQPLYDGSDKFYGVICVDLSLDKIRKNYFGDFSIGEEGKVYWLARNGDLYFQSGMDTDAKSQGEIFSHNLYRDETMGERKRKAVEKALSGTREISSYEENGRRKLLFSAVIRNTDSLLLVEADEGEFMVGYNLDVVTILVLGGLMLLISVLFIGWLNYHVTKPMNNLVNVANRISSGKFDSVYGEMPDSDLYEIRGLENAFIVMRESIKVYTQSLVEKNREINTILQTLDGTLMIVDRTGKVLNASKESEAVSPVIIRQAVSEMKKEKRFFSKQIVVGSEIYRNSYYPLLDHKKNLEKMVISSECITKSLLMEKEVQQIEKMAGIGQLSAAIVHELKNHLAVIKGAVYILRMEDAKNENGEEIELIEKAVDEAEQVIYTLLNYSRDEEDGEEIIHIGMLIKQILFLSKKSMIRKNIHVQDHIEDDCCVETENGESLKVIVQNIILNAIQAVDEDGRIVVACGEEKDKVFISVKNDGPPIPEEYKEKIFDPFFTTKEGGNGIGLWITRMLLDSLGGDIAVLEDENSMTEFKVILPTKH